jgi:hypothetical protein
MLIRLLLIAGLCSALLAVAPASTRADDEGEDWGGEAAEELNDAAADAGEQMPIFPFGPGKSGIEEVTEENEEQLFDGSSSEEE